ncbi:hypothetical protein [Archangium primigenium]|uniref:hypothetical protein n=1 Tax=[Archangium] primigenium TaxID=2792470 RepID=UPI001957A324|nr:hypothetical protein [Archangium primigenium]MBM7118785.1 hypothetical protein [Archangium primigenium]
MREPWRARTWGGVLAGAAALLTACPSPGARERYELEVLGSRAALERYTVEVEGLRDEGLLASEDPSLRRWSTEAETGVLVRAPWVIRSRDGERVVDELALEPFVCRHPPARYARMREEGWRFVERHQIQLTAEGRLRRDADLDRPLSYACEASPPSARDSREGWSTPLGTLGACTEPERAATQVVLETGDERRAAHLCHATYLPAHGGAVSLGFAFTVPGDEVPLTVALWHCMDPLTATYPLALEVGQGFPREDCPRRPGASGLVGGAPRAAPVLRGTWRISRLDFTDGGRLVGEVDAVFAVPGGNGEMRLRGPVDLPLLRIPLSGGHRP